MMLTKFCLVDVCFMLAPWYGVLFYIDLCTLIWKETKKDNIIK